MNSTDNTELNYICCTEAVLGQTTALANIALTRTECTTDLKALLLRCRELLKCLDNSNVHCWEIEELVTSSGLTRKMSCANDLQNSLSTMTRLADRLAFLETPRAQPAFKTKEDKDPEPFTAIQAVLMQFKNQLAPVLADVGYFTEIQHQLHYCFSLL